MRILFITNHLNTGGITSYCLTLAGGLAKRGHNVYIASSGGDYVSKLAANNINYIPIPIKTKSELSPKILISLIKLRRFIKQNQIDIIHANSRTTQVLGALLSKATGITYLSTCHGFFKVRFSRRALPCWGRKVIAISGQVKEHLVGDFHLKDSSIAVVYNGIDINRFKAAGASAKAEAKRKLGLSNAPVVGIIARLSDVKGHIYLVGAMRKVIDAIPQAQLLMVGQGKMKKELLIRVNKLGISRNVVFMPEAYDTGEILCGIDVFVMPSLKEGLGLALMEAMASELAVVGSNVGGIKSLIRHGVNGLLVEPADSAGLAGAILELLENPGKAEKLARQARVFIENNFSQEKMVLETEKEYLECLNAKYR